MGEVHDEPPLARLLGNSSQGVDNEVGKWRGGEGSSGVSCRALGIQVGLDDCRAGQRGAEFAGRTRAVAAAVAHPEPPGEALEQIAHKGLVGVGGQEGGQLAVAHRVVGVGGRWCPGPGLGHGYDEIWGCWAGGCGGVGDGELWGVGGRELGGVRPAGGTYGFPVEGPPSGGRPCLALGQSRLVCCPKQSGVLHT